MAALEAARERPQRIAAVEPPVPYPEDTLSYLANVYNREAQVRRMKLVQVQD